MTVCAFVKRPEAVYCIADSAVTTDLGISGRRLSSFGERQGARSANRYVEEGAFKLFPIPDSAVAGFAGPVSAGVTFLNVLSREIERQNVASALTFAGRDVGNDSGLEFLYANYDGAVFHVYKWRKGEVTSEDLAVIGSLPQPYAVVPDVMASFQRGEEHEEHDCLAVGQAAMQWLGVNNDLMAHGCGGAILGGFLGRNGFVWQKDVTYVVYYKANEDKCVPVQDPIASFDHSRPGHCQVVNTFVRSSALIVASTVGGEHTTVISSQANDVRWRAGFERKWAKDILRRIRKLRSAYYVFLGAAHGRVVVIRSKRGLPNNKHLRMRRAGIGFDVEFDEHVKRALFDTHENEGDADIGVVYFLDG
jgi:hypothetical protein